MLTGIVGASEIATVHGIAYEWSTFEPLDNVIIEVNSTPAQSIVAKYGLYSFELPNGSYLITAKYYQDDALTYYGEEVITITDEGNYVLDMLLLPSYSSLDAYDVGLNMSAQQEGSTPNSTNLLAGTSLIVFILLAVLIYQFHQKNGASGKIVKVIRKEPSAFSQGLGMQSEGTAHVAISAPAITPASKPENAELPMQSISVYEDEIPETEVSEDLTLDNSDTLDSEIPVKKPAPIPSGPVPSDLQEILDILRSQGGRMTQKDMRKRLHYSEGKVSLMLLDLEKRGKIQKFKKGRGNILFLVDEDES
jgi:uncharacterized membrane protein